MYEHKLSLREHIALLKRTFILINRITPGVTIIQFLSCFFRALIPSIAIYFSAKIINEISAGQSQERLFLLAGVTVGLELLAVILQGIFRYIFNQMRVRVLAGQDILLEAKAHALSYEDAQKKDVIVLRKLIEGNAENGVGGFFEAIWFTNNFFQYGSATVIALGMSVGLFLEAPCWMILILIVTIAGIVAVISINFNCVNQRIRTLYESSVSSSLLYDFFMVEYVDDDKCAKDIRVLEQAAFLNEELRRKMYNPFFSVRKDQIRSEGKHSVLTIGLTAALGGIVYLFVAMLAWNGRIDIGDVLLFYGAATQLVASVASSVVALSAILDNNYCVKPIFQYLDLPEHSPKGSIALPERSVAIEFQNVSYYYPGSNIPSLKDVSFKIAPGERIAIVGRNGSGKTTLAKVLCHLLSPQNGKITLEGHDIEQIDHAAIEHYMAVVFQDFRLFPISVGENVAGTGEYNEEKVWKALELVGIKEWVEGTPKKLNQPLYKELSKDGVDLSGGEAQKVAIARALYKNAHCMILDEPTASLDPISEADIYEKFNDIVSNKTIIYISHRLASCKFCDKIIVMDKGEIVEFGNHQELLSREGGIYCSLWRAQVNSFQKTQRLV